MITFKAYLSVFADHVHPFMTTMNHLLNGCGQQENSPELTLYFKLVWRR